MVTDQPTNLSEAVQALFNFLDKEIEIESQVKRVTLEAFKFQIKYFLEQQEKHQQLNGQASTRRGKASRIVQKRMISQPLVTGIIDSGDEDENNQSDGGVSSFEATPGFKRISGVVQNTSMVKPMMITRSQQKKTKSSSTKAAIIGRKRTSRQAKLT